MRASLIGVALLLGCAKPEPARLTTSFQVPVSIATESPKAIPDDEMVEIEGDYCPVVEQICLRWVDQDGRTIEQPPGTDGRCGEFRKPTRCLSDRKVHKHFLIDRFEYPNRKGVVPQSWMSWNDAKVACEGLGKRLCTHSEWTFAAEGPEMKPYPYGSGYVRDKTACNFDRHLPTGVDVFQAKQKGDAASLILDSMLVPSGSMPRCVSPWGVMDQIGNLDEAVVNESGKPYRSALVGGHVQGVRSRSRPSTIAHSENFKWYETCTRCCK